MEKAKRFLQLSKDDDDAVSRLIIPAHKTRQEKSFYGDFAVRGIRLDRLEPGYLVSTFTVPPRLTDREGKFSSGAIANLIDVVSIGLLHKGGFLSFSTVSLSISYLSTANLHDTLELSAQLMGQKGPIAEITVVIINKVSGAVVAQGRVTMLNRLQTKL